MRGSLMGLKFPYTKWNYPTHGGWDQWANTQYVLFETGSTPATLSLLYEPLTCRQCSMLAFVTGMGSYPVFEVFEYAQWSFTSIMFKRTTCRNVEATSRSLIKPRIQRLLFHLCFVLWRRNPAPTMGFLKKLMFLRNRTSRVNIKSQCKVN